MAIASSVHVEGVTGGQEQCDQHHDTRHDRLPADRWNLRCNALHVNKQGSAVQYDMPDSEQNEQDAKDIVAGHPGMASNGHWGELVDVVGNPGYGESNAAERYHECDKRPCVEPLCGLFHIVLLSKELCQQVPARTRGRLVFGDELASRMGIEPDKIRHMVHRLPFDSGPDPFPGRHCEPSLSGYSLPVIVFQSSLP